MTARATKASESLVGRCLVGDQRCFSSSRGISTADPTQAVWNRSGTPTTYYLHFTVGSSAMSFEYDSANDVLTSVDDGFAVTPGPAFAALILAPK